MLKASDTAEIYRLTGGAPAPIPEITRNDQVVRWDSANTLILATLTRPVRLERFRIDTRKRELIRTIAPASPAGVTGLFNLVVADDPNVYAYKLRQLSRLFLIQGAR